MRFKIGRPMQATLNETPSGERTAVSFFGCRNAGKSSLINALAAQEVSVVSPVKGTTTDPVFKAMELHPLGPVLLCDTPGFDDSGELGELRVRRTRAILLKTDIAVLVIDSSVGVSSFDRELVSLFKEQNIPFVTVFNKCELASCGEDVFDGSTTVRTSALERRGIEELGKAIVKSAQGIKPLPPLIADLVEKGDIVLLVVPIDKAAPKGRLILPQQQTIRELIDAGAVPVVCRESEIPLALRALKAPPALAVTDSQVFKVARDSIPPEVPLTSFSILMARRRGVLEVSIDGVASLSSLKDGDRILVAECCTHNRQCGDIGTVKIPAGLKARTKADLKFDFVSGSDFPDDLSSYAMVVHCGGCMQNAREIARRAALCRKAHVPFVNYGILLAELAGILKQASGI